MHSGLRWGTRAGLERQQSAEAGSSLYLLFLLRVSNTRRRERRASLQVKGLARSRVLVTRGVGGRLLGFTKPRLGGIPFDRGISQLFHQPTQKGGIIVSQS